MMLTSSNKQKAAMNASRRNDPCPCGSGIKHKKCCLGKHSSVGLDREVSPKSPQTTIDQSIQIGLAHQHAGRLQEAAAIYQQALQLQPKTPDALHLLGLIQHQIGNHEAAIDLISQAIEVAPSTPLYYCNAGLVLVALGQADVALACYQKALSLHPDFVEALNNMGNLLQDQGFLDESAKQYRVAISIRPDFAEAHYNLGNVLRAKRGLEEAFASYEMALQYKKIYPEAHNNAGVALAEMGRNEEALYFYRQAVGQLPDYADAHNNLGAALEKLGRNEEAREHLLRALELKPDYVDAFCNLGNLERSSGQLDLAIENYQKALSLNPRHAEACNNLGGVLTDLGRHDEAMVLYQKAVELAPDFSAAYNNIAAELRTKGEYAECISYSEKALALKPVFAEPYINIGNALAPLGRYVEARAAYRKVLEIEPRHAGAYSNLIFTMLYDNDISPAELYRESLEFAKCFEAPFIGNWPIHSNCREGRKRLKIGYVSADFRNHALAYFIEQVLANHDRAAFDIYCYYNHSEQDGITERLRKLADHWTMTKSMSDEAMVARIMSDEIDILVDLSGHTAGNRLPVFGRKPAPVQVTWMGYCGTTGLSAMDYRLTDAHLDPPGLSETLHTEQLVRLPASAIFQPDPAAPAVNGLPARAGNGFTFACLNNPSKLNERVIALWSRILKAVPDARMMLGNARATQEKWLLDLFARHGVGQERLLLQPRLSMAEYLALHHQVDLGLDPFPYNGGTTTMHALWMGVPVMTLRGESTISRVGACIMGNFGLTQFVAGDEQEYLERAVHMACNHAELEDWRQGLRARIVSNPARNPAAYTRAVEAAYRSMWRDWCQRGA